MPAAEPRPFGRDEVRRAILDAAARHFAAKGTAASLREIAVDAGVNLGLIHRHFGNKDELLRAVLAAQVQGAPQLVEDAPDVAAAMRDVFAAVGREDRYVRTVAWMLLAGVPAEDLQVHFPAIAALRARAGGPDDELDLLAAFALTYGWTVFGPQLLVAFGRDAHDRDAVAAHLTGVLERVLARP